MAGILPRRLFLDSGVIIEGCFTAWGSAKGVLILATLRVRFTVVLSEVIAQEIDRALQARGAGSDTQTAADVREGYLGWLSRVRVERWPLPTVEQIAVQLPRVLPALRHRNDLEAAISALQAQPDWVISSNQAHWGPALAMRTGLRIATPLQFLDHCAASVS
jgi:hypothetical protein